MAWELFDSEKVAPGPASRMPLLPPRKAWLSKYERRKRARERRLFKLPEDVEGFYKTVSELAADRNHYGWEGKPYKQSRY